MRPMRFESSDFIEDITSSEIMLIDDLAKVNMILKEVRKVSGSQRVDPTLTKLSDLVRKWPDFTHSEKNTSFATNTCYELHLFLKHKDPAYFKEVVRPFIACKMEKFFMDVGGVMFLSGIRHQYLIITYCSLHMKNSVKIKKKK